MESAVHIGAVDLVPFKYEVDVERPGTFFVENGDGFSMNLFTDLKYRYVESTIAVAIHRVSKLIVYACYSRF